MSWIKKVLKIINGSGVAAHGGTSIQPRSPFPETQQIPHLYFGRYSDNNKTPEQINHWRSAEKLYAEKKYAEYFYHFFKYLQDPELENVKVVNDGNDFSFTYYQGSTALRGTKKNNSICVSTEIARLPELKNAVLRKLLEVNYNYYYIKTGLNEKNIPVLIMEGDAYNMHPQTFYNALRELGTKGDKLDDELLNEFEDLVYYDHDMVRFPETRELNAKYEFFRKWINDTLSEIDALPKTNFEGTIAYLLLNLIYKIDFFLVPQGDLLAEIDRINGIYWNGKSEESLAQKNTDMLDGIRHLLDLKKEIFADNIFQSVSTFAITAPMETEKYLEHIHTSLRDARWYVANNYPQLARTLVEYGQLYCHFSFSLPKVQRDLIKVLMMVQNQDFINALGLPYQFADLYGKLQEKQIKHAVKFVLQFHQPNYEKFNMNPDNLNFDNMEQFGISLSEQIVLLNPITRIAS